ncbi:hypothetical protein ACWDRB_43505 [Nonomuraea sp. NPDC003707]
MNLTSTKARIGAASPAQIQAGPLSGSVLLLLDLSGPDPPAWRRPHRSRKNSQALPLLYRLPARAGIDAFAAQIFNAGAMRHPR